MRNQAVLHVVFSFLFCFHGHAAVAQLQSGAYADLGLNNVSEGLFVRMAGNAAYQIDKNTLEVLFRTDLLGNREVFVSGYGLRVSREATIRTLPFKVTGFFVATPFSDILRETNWGLTAGMQRNQWFFLLGTNFRTYAYNKKAIDRYGLEGNTRLHEKWNLMYTVRYCLKPADHLWNLSLAFTNTDHFLIHQETNPMLQLRGTYSSDPRFRLFLEAWYQQAGLFNINIHYFGFFIRPGIVWYIN